MSRAEQELCTGCGAGRGSGSGDGGGTGSLCTTAGSYTLTVTGTSGSQSVAIDTISLTVSSWFDGESAAGGLGTVAMFVAIGDVSGKGLALRR